MIRLKIPNRRVHYSLRNIFFAAMELYNYAKLIRCNSELKYIKPVILIIGHPRSGTSYTARVFNKAGLCFPGNHTPADAFNPSGYLESDRIVHINSDILHGSFGHWFFPPKKIRVYFYQRLWIRQELIKMSCMDQLSGWKDPRASLTLETWLDEARKLKVPVYVIAAFRRPDKVINSVYRHEKGFVERDQALYSWCEHNKNLVKIQSRIADRFFWTTVDDTPENIHMVFSTIAKKIGLFNNLYLDFFKQNIYMASSGINYFPNEALAIYQTLMKKYQEQWRDILKEHVIEDV